MVPYVQLGRARLAGLVALVALGMSGMACLSHRGNAVGAALTAEVAPSPSPAQAPAAPPPDASADDPNLPPVVSPGSMAQMPPLSLSPSAQPVVRGRLAPLPFSRPDAPSRSGFYFLPTTSAVAPTAILVLLHGLNSNGDTLVRLLSAEAQRQGIALIGPESAAAAWGVPDAGGWTLDIQYVQACLGWLQAQLPLPRPERLGAMGHSYGTRMAAALATNLNAYTAFMLSHGRYVPGSLGKSQPLAWFSGSPADAQFSFAVMQQQVDLFNQTYPNWPQGGAQLHTYDCSGCGHFPQSGEVTELVAWFVGGGKT
jgi:hypothetical protein